MKEKCLLVFIICFTVSCTSNFQVRDYPVLNVSLADTRISISDIFESIELIPLETSRTSLIKDIEKIRFFEDKCYVFDKSQAVLFIFDYQGKYLDKIDKIGKGPGEYSYIYDFYLDTIHKKIEMLSPFGTILYYNFDGIFEKQVKLPNKPSNYNQMEHLDDQNIIFWSLVLDNEDGLYVISVPTGSKVCSFFGEDNQIINTYASHVFHNDSKGNIYFMRPFLNEVYQVSCNGLKVAYSWDFGKQTNNIKKYKFPKHKDPFELNENTERFYKSLMNGEIPNVFYHFMIQDQNDLYYYAYLRFESDRKKHLFYNRNTYEYCLFEKTSEGIAIDKPLLMTNEYLITEFNIVSKDAISPYLSNDDKIKLANLKEENNPCLIKYVFKK